MNATEGEPTRKISMEEVLFQAAEIAVDLVDLLAMKNLVVLYGVPRGGIPAALAIFAMMDNAEITEDPSKASVIIDDVYDNGKTQDEYKEKFPNTPFKVLFDKRDPEWEGQWLVFPWEKGRED